ncbi:MAG: DEAD/DEAH box helicase family protein [Clostridia bacterium]|nr:DEAD/DEAH box helicase family protein [Clostridia bacterium]
MNKDAQLSLFDMFIDYLEENNISASTQDLENAIVRMRNRVEGEKKKERERKERERLRREREKKLEEKRREEAHIREVTCMDLPLTWENAFATDDLVSGIHAESPADGLLLSLENLGRVDMEYIAEITGEPIKKVIGSLRGSVYQNPETWNECFYKGWETADEYLSGNIVRKRAAAVEANEKYHGYFDANVKALDRVLPEPVPTGEIYVTLGSPWVPPDVIDGFMEHLFGIPSGWRWCWNRPDTKEFLSTKFDPLTGSWEIPDKARYSHNVAMTDTYGTPRIEALHILEKTLNLQPIAVTDEQKTNTTKSGVRRVLNQAETALALEKQKKLIAAFRRWVWKDEKRKERLEMIFENRFGCVVRRQYSGAFLTFPTMSPGVTLRDYQKDAVARILFSPNTLLAHDVGAGKTYVMIAAGMELRRTGRSKKNLYVVPNNIVGQWETIFRTMYPQAKLLTVEPKTFAPDKREKILERVRDEEFDGIIMAYSCFEQIPLSRAYYEQELEARKKELEDLAEPSKATKTRRAALEKIKKALRELIFAVEESYDGVYFDELGVSRLFVDEAHNYKNLPVQTKITTVLGVNKTGSKKCVDMLDKVQTVQRQNCGGGVVFATGTPITNSVTEAFALQQYLQSGELALLDLQSFDSWIGMFAEAVTEFEIDVDTSGYRLATRFAKFHNLPELTNLLAGIADFHTVDAGDGVPALSGYSDALIGKTSALDAYLKNISNRADLVRNGLVSRKDDNMLLITTDGRKAALDLRLADRNAQFDMNSKVYRCAENIQDIYFKTSAKKSAQLVFCDVSTPKQAFNMYDELKRLLTGFGIPAEEIAYVHSADTEAKREKLFSAVRRGEVRVLMGSTFKLGLGVNVQDKLIALHHLDVPWRPADMVQREGRILRQGNENARVQIFRYITEGSFDAYSWQVLETKQRFISDLLSGSLTARSGSDIADTVLDYAEVKALAVGDARVKERVETANEISRLTALQAKTRADRLRLSAELDALPGQIRQQEEKLANARADGADYAAWKSAQPVPVTTREKEAEADRRRALRETLFKALSENAMRKHETPLFEYAGFRVVLPAHMIREAPFVWLKRHGSYHVETGDTEVGGLIRLDNFLDNFPTRTENLNRTVERLTERKADIERELENGADYGDELERLVKKLAKIDKQLGVDKK